MSIESDRRATGFFYAYLLFTAGLSGGLVMVVEVLGSRVIGPYFGVSLFVWTALITVTLLSLSFGYALGGRLADRYPSPTVLYGLILGAGVLVALVPQLKPFVILGASGLDLRLGTLVSATVLFGPPLLLLGCVSPYLVRLAVGDWAHLGRTVGMLYAISTAGSFIGTSLTGFVLIAYIGVAKAFYLCGLILVLLGAGYFVCFARRNRAIALLVFLPLALLAHTPALPVTVMADGTAVRLIDHADSFYGNVKVVEYQGALGTTREMMIDGLIQGGIDAETGQSIYEYAYLMEHLAVAAKPDAKNALFIGLGPGVVVNRFEQRGISSEVVDIDPVVVRMAQQHFGFRPVRDVSIADGRFVLGLRGERYDIMFMDVFNGDITPAHLLSSEAISHVRARLTDDGVFVMNLIGSLAAESGSVPSILATLRKDFASIMVAPLFDPGAGAASGNMVVLASNAPLTRALSLRHVEGVHPLARDGVDLALQRSFSVPARRAGIVLTDDYNPLDVFDADVHEGVRKRILETTPPAILLHG